MTDRIKLLLIEDNPGDADLISEMLSDSDTLQFDIDCVERLSQALTSLGENEFDIVLADMGLPDSRGMDTLNSILKAVDDVPVIVLTGNADNQTAVSAVHAGAQDFLVKGAISGDLLLRSISYSMERIRNQVRLEHLNRVLLAIRNVNQLIVVEKDPERLIRGVCQHLTETRGFASAWIALLDRQRGLRGLAGSGWQEAMDELAEMLEEGTLPPCATRALDTSGVLTIDDPAIFCSDCSISHLYPGKWGLSVRLVLDESTYGVLTVSLPSDRLLRDEDEEFLSEVADDIAFALHDIELEAAHELALERKALHAGILETLNRTNEWQQLISDILVLIKDHTGFEAVGIRLADGEDYPYYETNGFGDEFIEKERYLCRRDEDGKPVVDERGNPYLECMCGNIIAGRTDPSKPFFTDGGSFWTNSTTELLSATSESDRQVRTRDTCNGEGYETVALVPIRSGKRTVGLLQLNDHRTGLLRPDRVHFFEELCDSIGIAFNRMKLRERIENSEARFRSIFESDMIGIIFWNAEGEITDANDAFLRMVGYDREELISGRVSWKEMTPPEYHQQDDMVMQELLSTGVSRPVEKEYIRKDGSRQPILIGAAMLGEGSSEGVAFVLDITDLRDVETALLESKVMLDAAGRIARIGGWEVDPHDLSVKWTGETYRIHGMPPSYVPGLDEAIDFFHPDDRDVLKRAIEKALREGEPYDLEIRLITAAGDELWTRTICEPQIRDGRVTKLTGIIQDITQIKEARQERDRLEAKFNQAQRLESVGRLAGGVAHDLNNLLTPILGYSGMLLDDLKEDDGKTESIKEIVKASNSARNLVKQLLAFSRKQLMEFTNVNLNDLIVNFEKLLRHSLREDIQIKLKLGDSMKSVRGDAGQLEQILMNLALNSQHAMPDGGTLTIETALVELDDSFTESHPEFIAGKYLLLTVSDTGTGMTPEVQEHIFEPFFTTKDMESGTGLGLATVYGITKQHDGYIYVYSEPGAGSTFKIYLPATSVNGTVHRPEIPMKGEAGKGETILVVEDDEVVRKLACMVLEKNGYRVLESGNPAEAVEMISDYEGRLDLVLTDVVMPKMNGKQLYDEVLKLHPGVKVLFMSGYTSNVIAHRGVIDDGLEFIHKPFSIDGLTAKIREVLYG